MIPILIYTLFKILKKQSRNGKALSITSYLRTCLLIIFFGLLVLFIVLIPAISKAQDLQLNYKIVQGGDIVGWMRIERSISGNKANLLLVSEVKTRIFIMIMVSVKESSTFENGRLICSEQYRKANGNIKVDKQMRLVDGQYQIVDKGEKENLAIPLINANLLSLYFREPIGVSTVYCDNYQRFIPIKKTTDGGYSVQFPDGNCNSFYYQDGVCTKIKISTTFYTATVLLNP
jgi:hypothetical protein